MTLSVPASMDVPPECAELVVYRAGDYLKGKEATVSIYDHGLLYGDGVFEGIRLYEGAFFRFYDHLKRLHDSLRATGIDNPFTTRSDPLTICSEVVRRNELSNAHIRLVVTRGVGVPGLDPANCVRPTVLAMAQPSPPRAERAPLSLITSSIRRPGPGSVDAKIKSLNYLGSVLAKYEARSRGVDDVVMLDPDGYVAEATGANLFVVTSGVLRTGPTTSALGGITRMTVMELAERHDIPVRVEKLTTHDLHTADEVFLCGSLAELGPVGSVDARPIGTGAAGQLTRRLAAAYRECVLHEREYRTPVHADGDHST